MKIVIISFTFQLKYFNRRWELFAESYPDMDVYLLTQEQSAWYSKGYTFGKTEIHKGEEVNNGNFHIRTFRQFTKHFWGWYSPDFQAIFNSIKPDIIYFIGGHCELCLAQIIHIRNNYLPKTKVIAFSMRGPHHNLHLNFSIKSLSGLSQPLYYIYKKMLLRYINKYTDAFFCHYPDAVQAFKDEGYCGPIYMQTQVGVNPEWFYENSEARKRIRDKYSILDSTFVFGTAVRFTEDKGIYDILAALPINGDWKYLMMGSGEEKDNERFKSEIRKRHLENHIILTGLIDRFEMADYWNAVDCAIHVPLTRTWVETFSLSVIQPMLLHKPIIGSSSGSVPYQIGPEGIIVKEGDSYALKAQMQSLYNNPELCRELGDKMYERARHYSIFQLNSLFYNTLFDILDNKYDCKKSDMTLWESSL